MSAIRQQTRFQATCSYHRWYGSWFTSRHRAWVQQWDHDATCVPERERWSDEVADAWRDAREIAERTSGINLRPVDLRALDEEQRLAFLNGIRIYQATELRRTRRTDTTEGTTDGPA